MEQGINATSKTPDFSDFNNTIVAYKATSNIVKEIDVAATTYRDCIAVSYKDKSIPYSELHLLSNKLAHYLIQNGVQPNDNVGLLVTRCPDIVTGMLGILKAGAAYVPIDPEYPAPRQEYIIQNSGIQVLIANTDYNFPTSTGNVRVIDLRNLDFDGQPDQLPEVTIDPNQLAYTIYTSGSTGNPKGVMIRHHSVLNLCQWVNKTYNIAPGHRLMFITSICFDLSVYDIFGTLFAGATIEIADTAEVYDLARLAVMLQEKKITFWDSVPTTLDFLVRGLEARNTEFTQNDLQVVFLSGDWIPVNLPERIKKFFPNAKVISLGGATEATVWSNYFPIEYVDPQWKSIPYGKPIDNNLFYILNDKLAPVPAGEQGELYIGGVGVAAGYANDKEKTDAAFIKDPFNDACGGRMYKTGDLGRMMPDGNMEFLGRKDQQVKIRGFRVELGEIESVVRQYKFVDQAVVIARKIDGLNRLMGYIVPKPRFDKDALMSFLRRKLPDYMVPGLWMELQALPLNPNGKIDRNALPEINMAGTGNEHIPPGTTTEKQIAAIWQQVLSVKEISINDNFFDLGGQSLLAVQMLAEVEALFNRKVNINTIFKHNTIASFAAFLEKETPQEVFRSVVPIKTEGSKIPLYIIHGDGYNFSNFRNLADCMDKEQPVYAIQPLGLDGKSETFDKMEELAAHYISEITKHYPSGPYALAGYSFGGYVAVEMKKQLETAGKEVSLLGIFDTDASNLFYKKPLSQTIFKKISRQLPKALFITKSLFASPDETLEYQKALYERKKEARLIAAGKKDAPTLEGTHLLLEKINQKHFAALNNYDMQPFTGTLHLFKAQKRIYFVDDFECLGWRAYARGGVKVHDVPGDHKTMFFPPNVTSLARAVQQALDEANQPFIK